MNWWPVRVTRGHSRAAGFNTFGFDPNDPDPQTRLLDSFSTARHAGADVISTGAGDDVVNAGGGNDVVNAGADQDVVAGYDGDDVVVGGSGDDLLYGGEGNDELEGDEYGLAGDDMLDGGAGLDGMKGWAGDDRYVIRAGDVQPVQLADGVEAQSGGSAVAAPMLNGMSRPGYGPPCKYHGRLPPQRRRDMKCIQTRRGHGPAVGERATRTATSKFRPEGSAT